MAALLFARLAEKTACLSLTASETRSTTAVSLHVTKEQVLRPTRDTYNAKCSRRVARRTDCCGDTESVLLLRNKRATTDWIGGLAQLGCVQQAALPYSSVYCLSCERTY